MVHAHDADGSAFPGLLGSFGCAIVVYAASAYTATAYEGGAILMPLNRELASVVVKNLQAEGKVKVLDVASGSGEPACSIAAQAPFAEARNDPLYRLADHCTLPEPAH